MKKIASGICGSLFAVIVCYLLFASTFTRELGIADVFNGVLIVFFGSLPFVLLGGAISELIQRTNIKVVTVRVCIQVIMAICISVLPIRLYNLYHEEDLIYFVILAAIAASVMYDICRRVSNKYFLSVFGVIISLIVCIMSLIVTSL